MREFFDQILYDYALSFSGLPYCWGGDDPMGSFDCSGLCIELLQSCGQFPHGKDATAQGLLNYFDRGGRATYQSVPRFGSLVFYGKSTTKVTHIGFALDRFRILEAGGGGPHVKTLDDAIKYNAFIRIRPYDLRKDQVAILRPYYQSIGKING
jgi:cell wall-associated NlpC family hydrolase